MCETLPLNAVEIDPIIKRDFDQPTASDTTHTTIRVHIGCSTPFIHPMYAPRLPIVFVLLHSTLLFASDPAYGARTAPVGVQELDKDQIPTVTKDGVTAIVIAGEALGISSPVYTRTPTHYM